jgi:hypothetical protein
VRFVLGSALVLWLPGHLAVGRHLRKRPLPMRCVLSLGLGCLALPVWAQLASVVGVGLRPIAYLPSMLALAAGLGLSREGRHFAASLDASGPAPGWLAWSALATVLLGLGSMLAGFADFVAPPTTHDAANHAFMTWRVTETGSVLAADVFGPPHGAPDLPYLPGLHAIASLVAQTSGLAPYVSVWLLALVAAALLPASLMLLWNEWRAPAAVLALAALLVAGNAFLPSSLLWYGLFAAAVGLLLVPVASLLLLRLWSGGSVVQGLAAGLGAGSLLWIHGSELPTVGLATGLAIALQRRAPSRSVRAWVAFLLSFGLVGWEFFATVVPAYLSGGFGDGVARIEPFADALRRTLGAVGNAPLLQGLAVLGIALGCFDRRWRPVSALAVAALVLVTTLAVWRDPVSTLLATPFYRQPERVRYLVVLIVSPLMAFAGTWIWARARAASWPPVTRHVALVMGLAALVAPDLPGIIAAYRERATFAPFSEDDFTHARGIAEIVGPEQWVANHFFDGSCWAAQVSGRRFLAPAGWQLTDAAGRRNLAIARRFYFGWPTDLSERFAYLYATDLRTGPPRGFTRERFDADPRYEPVLVGEHSTLYRVRWELGEDAPGPGFGRGVPRS